MNNYPTRDQLPHAPASSTSSQRGKTACLGPAAHSSASADAAITEQDPQPMDPRTRTANLLARLGAPISQPAELPATSTSPDASIAHPRPGQWGESMTDLDEQAPAHRVRTIFPTRPENGVLPVSAVAPRRSFARVFQPAVVSQTNPRALAHSEGPVHGGISTYSRCDNG